MKTFNSEARDAVAIIARATGTDVSVDDKGLTVNGVRVLLPTKTTGGSPTLTGSYADLFGIKGLLPTVPQGDDRDRLLWRIVAQATDTDVESNAKLPLDVDLERSLAEALPFSDPDAKAAITAAITDRFFSTKTTHNLKPMHSSLPTNFIHGTSTGKPARYRMFSGELIVFLLFDETQDQVDTDLLEDLLRFFDTTADLTALDSLFLKIAASQATHPEATTSAQALVDTYEGPTRVKFSEAGGVFCAPSNAQFRRDLRTTLDTRLPKPDKLQWLTLVLSLHIATRMYRLAVVKGAELDLAIATATATAPPPDARPCPCDNRAAAAGTSDSDGDSRTACLNDCPLAGAIKFRIGTGRYRPVSRRDACRDSYIQLDQRKLLALPAVLVTTNLALRAWTALGGPHHDAATATQLSEALAADPALRQAHSAVCAAITVLHHASRSPHAPTHVLTEAAGIRDDALGVAGLLSLRDSVLKHRRNDLRHQSRDVVNQLMLDLTAAAGGSLVSRNGTHTFFEADERMLTLLVRLICVDRPVPYEEFLTQLTRYGLAPQDDTERSALADSLERLGLLVRFSDAGEASFVHFD